MATPPLTDPLLVKMTDRGVSDSSPHLADPLRPTEQEAYALSLTSLTDTYSGETFSTWNMSNDYHQGGSGLLSDSGLTWQPAASGESWDDLWPFLLDSSITSNAPDTTSSGPSRDEIYLMKLWLSRPRPHVESVDYALPYRPQSRIAISPEFYQALCTFFCNNLPSANYIVEWGQQAMQQSLDYFFESASFPLLHSPTFTVEEGGLLVVSACIALGAYSRDSSGYGAFAVSLGTAILKALYNMQIPVLPPPPNCPEQTPLQICQASLLCSHLALLTGDRALLLSAQLFQVGGCLGLR
jgi:hypothetical protein